MGNIIQAIIAAIEEAGKIVTDVSLWSLRVEDPYDAKPGDPITQGSVDSVTVPDKSSLQIKFTYKSVQYTMVAQANGNRAQISFNGSVDAGASMVVVPEAIPMHIDVRPVKLPSYANVVRLDFRFDL